jgi:competence protein ComEC
VFLAEPGPAAGLLLLAFAAGAWVAGRNALGGRLRSLARRVALTGLFGAAGMLAAASLSAPERSPVLDALVASDAPVRFTGRIAEPLTRRIEPPRWKSQALQHRLSLVLDLDSVESDGRSVPIHARVLLGTEDAPLESHVGDRVEGVARLFAPSEPSNPGEPDPRKLLRLRGISYVGSLQRGALATLVPSRGFARRAEEFRNAFAGWVAQRLGDPARAALVAALAVGERGGVDTTLEREFNASGLAHVLSISGLHLAVAVAALSWLLWRLLALSEGLAARIAPRRLAALVSLPITLFYVAFVGAPAPAVRAGLGLSIALAGVALGRPAEGLNTLGWCLAAVTLVDPASLADISTQLSFLGVLGLVWLMPRLRSLVPLAPPDPSRVGWAGWTARAREALMGLALGSLAATLATAPLTALYFERASLVAALANLVAWPASTLIVPAGALGAALYPLSPALAGPLVDLAGLCAAFLAGCAHLFAAWPAAAISVAPPSPAAFVGWALLVAGLASLRTWRRGRALAVAALGALGLALAAPRPAPLEPGRLELTFLSVGQGDSTVIRFPRGATMVVDAGGEASMRYDPGARVVAPFLRSKGISRIDVLAASHPHPDHVGGVPALFERFAVSEYWHDGDGVDEGPGAALLETAREAGARPVDFRQGLPAACPGLPALEEALPEAFALSVGDPRCAPPPPTRDIDGVQVEILHPLNGPDRAAYPELGENDNSLVLRLTHGDVRILLAGDLEREGEALLLARGGDLTAELLKAPHHGSKTSSTPAFIGSVRPRHVVFCVGARNQWGFPAPEVVDRYAAAGAERWRTDQNGAVTFVSDGRSLTARPTWTSPAEPPRDLAGSR